MRRFCFSITSNAPYPVTTDGNVECNSWNTAASRAVKMHMDNLRCRKQLRKADEMFIKVWRVKAGKVKDD